MEDSMLQLHPGLIVGFAIAIIAMLAIDLGVANKTSHVISTKEAAIWTIIWISMAMLFSGVVYLVYNNDGHQIAVEKFTQFQAAYWIEKALSVDNLFVFILIFSFFKVPKKLHHKVLFWGIIGAVVFRAIFIFAGIWLINLSYLPEFSIGSWKFCLDPMNHDLSANWENKEFFRINVLMTLFGIFLIVAGIKALIETIKGKHTDSNFDNSPGAKLVKRLYKVSDDYDGEKFFTVKNGVKYATPLLVVVVIIEFSDILFAVDSIPAIFAISKDPFILYTSNIFAILGLRSLYFLLENLQDRFSKLPYGLSIILAFIGTKMIISPWYEMESTVSLTIVGSILVLSIVLSFLTPKKELNVSETTE